MNTMDENIIRINSNTWRIEDGFVRAFLLTGSERAMLIDSGVSGMDVKSMAESHPEDVHGNMIKCYDFDSCGFYC